MINTFSSLVTYIFSLILTRFSPLDEAFLLVYFNFTSCLINFSSCSWHVILNLMFSPNRERQRDGDSSWDFLLTTASESQGSVCSNLNWSILILCFYTKHILKIDKRLAKKVFFYVWLAPIFLVIIPKFSNALLKFVKPTLNLAIIWCWNKHLLHCLKQLPVYGS